MPSVNLCSQTDLRDLGQKKCLIGHGEFMYTLTIHGASPATNDFPFGWDENGYLL